MKAENRECAGLFLKKLSIVLKELGEDGLKCRLSQLAQVFRETDPVDYQCLEKHLEKHIIDVKKAIKDFYID